MAKLSKKDFFEFVVSLPERGDVAGMERMLAERPAHRDELLFGVRSGVDDGQYSAMRYATWLSQFDFHDSAKDVVRWLLTRGHEPDVWTAIALDDAAALRAVLEADPSRARARHPLFDIPALEQASAVLRPILLEHGADDGSISTALFLGDLDRARAMIREDPGLLRPGPEGKGGGAILMRAVCLGLDDFACELLDAGVRPQHADGADGYSVLTMAANWDCPRTVAKLLELGVDVNGRSGSFTAFSMLVSRSRAEPARIAGIARILLDAGAKTSGMKVDGKTPAQWCGERGLREVQELLAARRRRGRSSSANAR